MTKVYYAVKYNRGEWNGYWTRNGSPTPALFLTEAKARATVRLNTAITEDEYTIVTFMEVE